MLTERAAPVVVHHEAWICPVRWAEPHRAAAPEPLPGIPPTAGDPARTLDRARSAGARAILRAPFEPQGASDRLVGKAGIPVPELPFAVGGQPEADGILGLFETTPALPEEGIGHRP